MRIPASRGWPLALLIGLACVQAGSEQPWSLRRPAAIRRTGVLRHPTLRESSAAARGLRNPEVLWTVNDSGNEAAVFAVDTTGTVVASLQVLGAANTDWEALSIAPCGAATACLYIGDVGDNLARRRSVTIYRVEEPPLDQVGSVGTVPLLDSLVVTYEGGAHDVEAMVVTAAGDVVFIAKGWTGPPAVHRVSSSAWGAGATVALRLATLPIATGMLHHRLVTDAALSPTGRRLAVRTYGEIFLFDRGPETAILPDEPASVCDIADVQPLGEGITWWDESTLLLTSERTRRREGTVVMVRCGP